MRFAGIVVGLLLIAGVAAQAQGSADDAAIRAVLAQENEGWDRFDAKQVASVFTDDATWQNPFGVRLHGKVELEKFLTDLLARPGYRQGKSTVPTKILEVRLTSPTSAAVWSDERIEGVIPGNSGVAMPPRHSYYLTVMVKQGGAWKVSDVLIMDIIHPK